MGILAQDVQLGGVIQALARASAVIRLPVLPLVPVVENYEMEGLSDSRSLVLRPPAVPCHQRLPIGHITEWQWASLRQSR